MKYLQEINGTDLDLTKRQGRLQERNLLTEIFHNALRENGAQNGDGIVITRKIRFSDTDFKSSLRSLHNDKTHAEKIAAKATVIVEMIDRGNNKFDVVVTAEVKGQALERNLGSCSVQVIPALALEDEPVQAQAQAQAQVQAPARQARQAPSMWAQGLLGRRPATKEQARIASTRDAAHNVGKESDESKGDITNSFRSGITIKA